MKMKLKKLSFIMFTLSFCMAFGQKVKVKKEHLFINKKDVGFFTEKKVYERQKQFIVLNKEKDTVFLVGREVVFSLLDNEDEIYLHEIFSIPSKNIKINYPIGDGYYLNAKSIIRHFISKGIIDEELNLDEGKLKELVGSKEEYPESIKEVLIKEKEEMKPLDYIAEKVKEGKISLQKTKSTSKFIDYIYRPNKYYFDEYNIYSEEKDNTSEEGKVLMGKIIFRYPLTTSSLDNLNSNNITAINGDLSRATVFVYNLKGGRVARFDEPPFGSLRVYKNKEIFKRKLNGESIVNELNENKNVLDRVKSLVEWLILQGNI